MRLEYNLSTGETTEHDDAPVIIIPKTLAQIVEEFENAIQQYLDKEAQSVGYDDILSACSYAAAENPFQAEAITFVQWRGNVWAYCYGELAKVESGDREMPTIEQIISELPVR